MMIYDMINLVCLRVIPNIGPADRRNSSSMTASPESFKEFKEPNQNQQTAEERTTNFELGRNGDISKGLGS